MKSCRLPKELQLQIRTYYSYSWTRHKTINAQGFFEDLSPGLRSKTTFYLYQDVLCSVPLFSRAPVAVLETLALAVRYVTHVTHVTYVTYVNTRGGGPRAGRAVTAA